jgi:hypothetical protein
MANPEAIIADDEEQLRIHLKSKLAELWPELIISTRHRLPGHQDAGIVRNRSGPKN